MWMKFIPEPRVIWKGAVLARLRGAVAQLMKKRPLRHKRQKAPPCR
jgi:hypothetical protein